MYCMWIPLRGYCYHTILHFDTELRWAIPSRQVVEQKFECWDYNKLIKLLHGSGIYKYSRWEPWTWHGLQSARFRFMVSYTYRKIILYRTATCTKAFIFERLSPVYVHLSQHDFMLKWELLKQLCSGKTENENILHLMLSIFYNVKRKQGYVQFVDR